MKQESFRIFLSWSGDTSRRVANCLKDWLETVFENVSAWMSDQDIALGGRSLEYIDKTLDEADMAILVLTTANQSRPWVTFEAGALSRPRNGHSRQVIPLIVDSESVDVLESPLSMFQGTVLSEEGIKKLLVTLSKAQHLDTKRVDTLLRNNWSDLESELSQIPALGAPSGGFGATNATEEQLNRIERMLLDQQGFGPSRDWFEGALKSPKFFWGTSSVARLATKDLAYYVSAAGWQHLRDANPDIAPEETPSGPPLEPEAAFLRPFGLSQSHIELATEILAEVGLSIAGLGAAQGTFFIVPTPMPTVAAQLELQRRLQTKLDLNLEIYVGPPLLDP